VIVFARHGETAVNREGRLQGRVNAVLDERGTMQAAALAAALSAERVARVVSSPLRRAQQTAETIAAAHDLPVELDDRLIELDYGIWDGVAMGDVSADDWARWRTDPSFAPPGGESLVEVTKRVVSFCQDALTDEIVVAVSHVSPIKAAVCWALGADESASWRMHLAVASLTRVAARPDGAAVLLSYNETAHLPSP
jgi:broad specificity phosphatase PhoE